MRGSGPLDKAADLQGFTLRIRCPHQAKPFGREIVAKTELRTLHMLAEYSQH